MNKISHIIWGLLLLGFTSLFAQTTGKIAGYVFDQRTSQPLPGANIYLEGTNLGAASGLDGSFYIINIPPGKYNVVVEMVGYEKKIIKDVRVSVNRTSNLKITLKESILEGEVIVVEADKMSIKKDQTSAVRTVSSDQMEALPVENLNAVIGLQAGVVQGHFRGGRSNEVSYMIDGLQVNDAFGGEGRRVDVETEAIQDVEIITGTFNAEYGRAMSGVVNAIIKDGGDEFHFSYTNYLANYVTPHDDIFIGLKESEITRNQDYKLQLSGPIIKQKINYFANIRYQNNKNHLNGIRRFRVNDFSDFTSTDPAQWYSEHTGDNAYVPMNSSKNLSILTKLSYKLTSQVKLSLLYTGNRDEWKTYEHTFKYNPDGQASHHRESDMFALLVNHAFSNSAFYELKLSSLDSYYGFYLFKNPRDSGYVYDAFLANVNETGFYTGGQMKDHTENWQKEKNIKFDFTWQATAHHSLKTGFLYTMYDLTNKWTPVRHDTTMTEEELGQYYYDETGHRVYYNYKPIVYPDNSVYSDIYHVKPIAFSAYLQDKMEYEDMVINAGVRFDYFDPKTTYPSNWRNPANQLNFYLKDENGNLILDENGNPQLNPERMSTYPKADAKMQISPRLGLAYQLGKRAVLHFSYGHFFQMPPMYAMYQNNSHQIPPSDYATTLGNPQLKAQKTVQYEVGLWQELIDNMGLEVNLFYRDIYDLLSTKIVSTYNQIEYGLYTNKDYGNARGIEFKFDFYRGPVQIFVNYTLQYTRGNADNPEQTFTRAGASMDPIPILIPMSWDQRHTFNATVGYHKNNLGLTLTGYYNSGTPYTWTPIVLNPVSRVNLYPNNDYMPSSYSVDFFSYYKFALFKRFNAQIELSIYNLFDRLNPVWVYGSTGQPYTAIIQESDRANHRSDFNDYEDRIKNPSAYSAPRMVKLGLGISF